MLPLGNSDSKDSLAQVWDEMCNSLLSNTASAEFNLITFYSDSSSCNGEGPNPSRLLADRALAQRACLPV